jgi:UDP-glucose 4-epimerase
VLVTGGGGFIGGHLCGRLIRDGSEVHVVSRQKGLGLPAGAFTHQADLSDAESVESLISSIRPRIVFHLASEVTGNRELDQVQPTLQSNLVSTVNLLVAATRTGCDRIVMTGSMEEPRRDDTNPLPGSPYAAAKWASTVYARMFHGLYGARVVVLRVFMVFGPGQLDERKIIPYTARCLLQGVAPKLTSGGRPVDWIYVDDVVDALMASASATDVAGRVIDVGSGIHFSIREVVEALEEIIGSDVEPLFGALPERPLEGAPLADLEQARVVLGWEPKTSLKDGLRRTVDWLRLEEEQEAEGD